jgi:hypothetical protein
MGECHGGRGDAAYNLLSQPQRLAVEMYGDGNARMATIRSQGDGEAFFGKVFK